MLHLWENKTQNHSRREEEWRRNNAGKNEGRSSETKEKKITGIENLHESFVWHYHRGPGPGVWRCAISSSWGWDIMSVSDEPGMTTSLFLCHLIMFQYFKQYFLHMPWLWRLLCLQQQIHSGGASRSTAVHRRDVSEQPPYVGAMLKVHASLSRLTCFSPSSTGSVRGLPAPTADAPPTPPNSLCICRAPHLI